jgi:hypothetical protein
VRRHLLAALAAAAAISIAGAPAEAHPAPFTFLDVRLDAQGVHGSLTLHDFDVSHDLGITPPEALLDDQVAQRWRAALVQLVTPRLTLTGDGQAMPLDWGALEVVPDRFSVRLHFRSPAPVPARLVVDGLLFPYDPIHQTFVNIYEDGALRHQAILSAGAQMLRYFGGKAQTPGAVIGTFVPAGIEHILIGPDHVLFLVGLLLLGGRVWRLAGIVTAFTVGHSITLSLAALDLVSPPGRVVEPLIALTIIVVGADNLLVMREKGGRDPRALFAGAFGLVHGFGFASVLKQFGLPRAALGWSLFSFNLGVEIGQLFIVITVAGLLALAASRSSRARHWIAVAGSWIVIAAGTYWFVERLIVRR